MSNIRLRRPVVRVISGALVVLAANTRPAAAQVAFDARVGPDVFGRPVELRGPMLAHAIAALAHATGIPIGWEYEKAPAAARFRSTPLSGLTVRDALDVLARESRCEWREMSGVIVCRPPAAWDDARSPLNADVPAVTFRQTNGHRALTLVARLLGAPPDTQTQFSDTRRFPLQLERGTVLDLLNATVRAHGDMSWLFEHQRRAEGGFPYIVTLMSGEGAGGGLGVSGPFRPVVSGGPPPALEHLDLSGFEVPEPDTATAAVLARVVGPKPDGSPLVVNGPYYWPIRELAAATRTPFGLESAPPGSPHAQTEFVATGRSLGDVLEAITRLDPRYQWREMNGVIVVRPVTAWSDGESPLFALAPPVRLDGARSAEAVAAAAVAMGRQPTELVAFPDGRRVSVDLQGGTMLDLLNAIVRSHGELCWTYTPADRADAQRTGLSHTLSFGVFNGVGTGVLVR
jgi:hypothetical protein